jgi:hypothetical protein
MKYYLTLPSLCMMILIDLFSHYVATIKIPTKAKNSRYLQGFLRHYDI